MTDVGSFLVTMENVYFWGTTVLIVTVMRDIMEIYVEVTIPVPVVNHHAKIRALVIYFRVKGYILNATVDLVIMDLCANILTHASVSHCNNNSIFAHTNAFV